MGLNVHILKIPCVKVAKKKNEALKMGLSSCTPILFADALIAAEIGDLKDLQAQVDALEMTNIALQAGYDGAEKDRLYWVDKYKEAEHCAEVYKRALHIAHTAGEFAYYVEKAEKELAEERKDEN